MPKKVMTAVRCMQLCWYRYQWGMKCFLVGGIATLLVSVAEKTTPSRMPGTIVEDWGWLLLFRLLCVAVWVEVGHRCYRPRALHHPEWKKEEKQPVEFPAQARLMTMTLVVLAAGSRDSAARVVQPVERDRDHTRPCPPTPSRRPTRT